MKNKEQIQATIDELKSMNYLSSDEMHSFEINAKIQVLEWVIEE